MVDKARGEPEAYLGRDVTGQCLSPGLDLPNRKNESTGLDDARGPTGPDVDSVTCSFTS